MCDGSNAQAAAAANYYVSARIRSHSASAGRSLRRQISGALYQAKERISCLFYRMQKESGRTALPKRPHREWLKNYENRSTRARQYR